MQMVLDLLRLAVSLRSAWLMSRAWRPTWVSPISPSISARGVRAATESMTTHVERARADQHVGDLERLLARVGLGDEQLVDVDADGRGVDRVHGVLGVDVGADAAVALGLGHDVHGEGGLARRLRAEDLDDPAPGQAADAEGEVERERAGGDGLDRHRGPSRPCCMIEPLPNCFSIWPSAMSSALSRSTVMFVSLGECPALGRLLLVAASGPAAIWSTLRRGCDTLEPRTGREGSSGVRIGMTRA